MTDCNKFDFLNNPLFTTEEAHIERKREFQSNSNPLLNQEEFSKINVTKKPKGI